MISISKQMNCQSLSHDTIATNAMEFIQGCLNNVSASPSYLILQNIGSKNIREKSILELTTLLDKLPFPIQIGVDVAGTNCLVDMMSENEDLVVSVSGNLPLGFVQLSTQVPKTRTSSDCCKVNCDEWLKRLSNVPFADICKPTLSVDCIRRVGTTLDVSVEVAEEGIQSDCKLFDEEVLLNPLTEARIKSLLNRSLFPCLSAMKSTATIWIGVEDKSRCVIGIPSKHVNLLNFESAITNALAEIFPPIPLSNVLISSHQVLGVDPDNFREPVATTMVSQAALAVLQCLVGRVALAPTGVGKLMLVVIDKEVLCAARGVLLDGRSPIDDWEKRIVNFCKLSKCSTRWLKDIHKFVKFDSAASMQSFSRQVIRIQVTVPSPVLHVACSTSTTYAFAYDLRNSQPSNMTLFQIWLRSRTLTARAKISGLHYRLLLDNLCVRVLYFANNDEKVALERALHIYLDSQSHIFVCVSDVDELLQLLKSTSWRPFAQPIIVGSLATLTIIAKSLGLGSPVDCLVFCQFTDVHVADDVTARLHPNLSVVDIAHFPLHTPTPVPSPSMINATAPVIALPPTVLTAVPSMQDVPELDTQKCAELAGQWMCVGKREQAPWQLVKAGKVFMNRAAEILLSHLRDSRWIKLNHNQQHDDVQVKKRCACSGITSMLQSVAWHLQNVWREASCYFIGNDTINDVKFTSFLRTMEVSNSSSTASSASAAAVGFDTTVIACRWIVLFADDDVTNSNICHIKELVAGNQMDDVFVSIVSVSFLQTKHTVYEVHPFLSNDEFDKLVVILLLIWPDSSDVLRRMKDYVLENATVTNSFTFPDRHIYVVILAASGGTFQPIREIVQNIFDSEIAYHDLLTVLALISEFCPRISYLKLSAIDSLSLPSPVPHNVKKLVHLTEFSISFLHPFVAALWLQCLEDGSCSAFKVLNCLRDRLALSTIDWESLARSLLCDRMSGKILSPFLHDMVARREVREVLSLLDIKTYKIVKDVKDEVIDKIKSRILRIEYFRGNYSSTMRYSSLPNLLSQFLQTRISA